MRKNYLKALAIVAGFLSYTNSSIAQYCTFTGTNSGRYINNFSTTGGAINITNNGSGFSTGGYNDATAMAVSQYETASVNFSAAISGGSAGFNIWVDWNNNQVFDATEKMYASGSYVVTTTGSVTVPTGTALGDYRMRIVSDWGNTDPVACGTSSNGEAEDYTFTVIAPPTCMPITGITLSALTSNTADITWTAGGTEASWNIEWGAPGYTPGTGTEIGAASNSSTAYQITGLTANTNYDVYVQADCGGGDLATWQGPFSIYTGYCFVSTTYTGDYLSAVSTTSANTNVSYSATSQPAGSYSDQTAQLFEAYAGQTFDVNTTYVGGSNGVNVWIDLNQNLTFETTELVASLANSSASKILPITIPGGTALGNYRIRVRGQYGTTANPPACGNVSYGSTIDFNLTIVTPPSCIPISALTLTSVGANTADITWTAGGTETSWNIEWGTPGYTPGTGTEIGAATYPSTAYQITGLNPTTSYDIYVQADCGGSGVATWYGPLNATTACAPVVAPWTETFENSGTIPSCWNQGTSNLENWKFANTGSGNHIGNNGTITGTTASSGYFAWVDDSSPDNMGTTLESPLIDISTLTIPELSFYLISNNEGYSNVNFSISVFDGATWHNNFYTHNTNTSAGGWEKIIVNLSSLTFTGNMQLRFVVDEVVSGDFYDDVAIDDIDIHEQPTCPEITGLSEITVYTDSVNITWIAGGTETAWNIQWGTPGFTPGSGTEIGAASYPSTTYMVTGLSPNTNYDVYVQANCGSDSSAWYGPLNVYTGYCTPTNTYSTSYYISGVSTTGALQNLNNTGTGFGTNGYTDYSNTNTLIVYPGQQIDFTFSHPSSTYDYSAWIDWNNNLDFSDVGDQILSSGYQSSPYTTSYTIPLTAIATTTRLRIRNAYLSNPAPACGTFNYGEAEDYTIQIVVAPSCLPVTSPVINNVGIDTIQLSWTAGGLETSWNVQWGAPGFAPGTGAEIGAASTPTTTYTVNGLNPSTTYDIYVQANCGSDSSYWALVTGTTLCAPISTLPWTENFDGMTNIGNSLFPNCWLNESGDWFSDNGVNGQSYSAPNNVSIEYGSDDYLWTPEFNLTAGTTYEFAFRWIGDGYSGWNGGVYYSQSQSSASSTQIGTNFISATDISSSTDYKKEIYCFTPTTSGVYSFGIYVSANYNPYILSFDNFSVRIPSPNAGTNGATTVCQTGGLVDLNSVISISDTTGVWAFSSNPSAIQSDTLFNPASIPSGTSNVYYVVSGCVSDSATATINIYPKSNAGTDGTVSTCNYGPLNLFDGLTGNVDLGGQWYNPASQPIPGSMVNFNGEIAANYNYIYVVSNGVCPNDTSVIEIQLQDCAGVDEYELKGFVLYPNPSNGIINIQYSGKGEDVKLDVVDAKGAIVWSKQVLFNDNTTQTIDLSTVENGVYYINMTSKNGGSVMKVVKN